MKNALTNQEIHGRLCKVVLEKFLSKDEFCGHVYCGPLEINDFSICFKMDVKDRSKCNGVYVKIPKENLYKKSSKQITPLSTDDRKFALGEYRSLVHLLKFWRSDDINVFYVKPLTFISEYNAIVTELAYGKDLFREFRRYDVRWRLRTYETSNKMHGILFRLGKGLRRFHETSMREERFSSDATFGKVQERCFDLRSLGISCGVLDKILTSVDSLEGYFAATHRTKTLKGLDIRNVLIDKDENLYMLDPGKINEDYKEVDLARFLVTCRILYWGSIAFFLHVSPDRSYEESFLLGYFGRKETPNKVLIIFIVKELLKHWYLAHLALQLKSWPKPFKTFLRRFYIDPFYEKQITAESTNLAKAI
jgi:hypothetical protein